jgi:type II secretory pathway pseudopilin PulG
MRKTNIHQQQGIALLMLLSLLSLVALAFSLQQFNLFRLRQHQQTQTQQALAQARQALLAYAAKPISETNPTCGKNCPRPGDLPCPDLDNDGDAEISCGKTQNLRLGRLPWKTLGLGDIRDGAGERLWYAVSNQYKNNPRLLPLNSDSVGGITLRNIQGNMVLNSSLGQGAVALVIAPNAPLTRSDNVQQLRSPEFALNANQYLDLAQGEDNADFIDNDSNGFITGEIQQNGKVILNDSVLVLSQVSMNQVMQARVLAEVMQALLNGICPNRVDIKNRTCTGNTSNDFMPDPASVSDSTCLGNNDISGCLGDAAAHFGRLPSGIRLADGQIKTWESINTSSILRGQAQHNWLQQNAWRELIFYALAPACKVATPNCTGLGFLQLKQAKKPCLSPQDKASMARPDSISPIKPI